MEQQEWIARCSARLHGRWPRLDRLQRDEVATDLWHEARWREMEPELALVRWLSQGIPAQDGSDGRTSQ